MNERQVLKKLNAKDFRSITKEQIIQFASNLGDYSEEIQKKILDQFPQFSNVAEAISNRYCELVQEYLKDSELIKMQCAPHHRVLNIYQKRIEELGDQMSHTDFMAIMLDMQEEADKIDRAIAQHHERRERAMHTAAMIGSAAIAIPATAVGIVKFVVRR